MHSVCDDWWCKCAGNDDGGCIPLPLWRPHAHAVLAAACTACIQTLHQQLVKHQLQLLQYESRFAGRKQVVAVEGMQAGRG